MTWFNFPQLDRVVPSTASEPHGAFTRARFEADAVYRRRMAFTHGRAKWWVVTDAAGRVYPIRRHMKKARRRDRK